jgi:hypothetical protein
MVHRRTPALRHERKIHHNALVSARGLCVAVVLALLFTPRVHG